MEAAALHPPRLGDILVAQGALTRSTLEDYALRAHGRIGDFLKAHGLISARALARGIATQQHLPFIDFERFPPDQSLFQPNHLNHYIQQHYVPYARARDGLIVATSEPSAPLQSLLQQRYGMSVKLLATAPHDLNRYFASVAATTTTRRAQLSLRRRYRHLVADRILLPTQWRGFFALLAMLLLLICCFPESAWLVLLTGSNLFYLLSLQMKLQLYKHGHIALRQQHAALPALRASVAALRDEELPIYSILVPLYMESPEVMARLISNLSALDYPPEKLDIKLICEEDDHATLRGLKALRPPPTMQIIPVSPSHPRTKPKACNVALQQIRGEFLVIFDAEDAPATDQLKRAVAMFRAADSKLACLQAALNYYNRDENLLTQLFAIEYSGLFRLSLPALQRMRMPIPLGGTSNHLRVSALTEAGGWDAFNVTEDADLGIRLAYLGYYTKVLPSLTLEEAPISLGAWMRQRTRWIKGYIQTWLVYMRQPAELKKRLGSIGYYGFQFFVGAPALTFLLAPFFWAIYLCSLTGYRMSGFSLTLQMLCIISFLSGVVSNWIFAKATLRIERWQHMRLALLMYPLYWLLHSIAAARALWQLAFNPHYWGKTRHGVSRYFGN